MISSSQLTKDRLPHAISCELNTSRLVIQTIGQKTARMELDDLRQGDQREMHFDLDKIWSFVSG